MRILRNILIAIAALLAAASATAQLTAIRAGKLIDPDSGEISYHAHLDHSDKLALNPGNATGVGRKYTEK